MMNQQITLVQAQALVSNLASNPIEGLPISESFDLEIINALISQESCAGLRVYFGMKEDNSVCVILVAVDDSQNDITVIIAEDGYRCPPLCPGVSIINLL